jgi:Flp pilus assembly protein TadD
MAIRAPRQLLTVLILLVAGGAALCAAGQPEFHRDIAPILFSYCASCHHAGGTGPFPLITYDDARRHAREIASVTHRRYMPPWLPEPGYGEFEGERRLTDAQIQVIAEWVNSGTREGSRSGVAPPAFNNDWQLGQPDLVITSAKPYTVPADGPDVFWNFVLAPGARETRYVQAIEIRPGNTRAVHHANLLLDRAASARLREKAPGEGFQGMDVSLESESFDPDSHFLFWKPGGIPWREPAGMAWRLDPGNALVLNVHLRPIGRPEPVQPSVAFYFTREPPSKSPMLIQLEHDGALDIPPGDADFVVSDEIRLPVDLDVLAVYPHAHYLGKLLEGFATLPDGQRRWLIRIPDWDLNWQAVYRLKKPLFLPQGTVISMRYHYDNSTSNSRNPHSPPKRVRGGNQGTDEMAHLWLQVLPRVAGHRQVLQEAVMVRRLEKYPSDFLAHFNLGALFLSRKQTPTALEHLTAALQVQPEHPAALNTYGVALDSAGRLEEAADQFHHVLRVRPGDTSARYNLAGTLATQGRLEEAASNYRKVMVASPDDRAAREKLIQLLRELGDRSASEGQLTAATESYRELAALDPRNPDIRNNFGILLARSGDTLGAIAQFEAALQLDPQHASARRNLEIARKRVQH